jgi:hypothetical protein
MNAFRTTRMFALVGLMTMAALGFSDTVAQAFHGGDGGSNCHGAFCSLSPSDSSSYFSGCRPSYTDLSSLCPNWCSFPCQPTIYCAPQTGYAPIANHSYQPVSEYAPVYATASLPMTTWRYPAYSTPRSQPTVSYPPSWYVSGHSWLNFNLKK